MLPPFVFSISFDCPLSSLLVKDDCLNSLSSFSSLSLLSFPLCLFSSPITSPLSLTFSRPKSFFLDSLPKEKCVSSFFSKLFFVTLEVGLECTDTRKSRSVDQNSWFKITRFRRQQKAISVWLLFVLLPLPSFSPLPPFIREVYHSYLFRGFFLSCLLSPTFFVSSSSGCFRFSRNRTNPWNSPVFSVFSFSFLSFFSYWSIENKRNCRRAIDLS